MYTLQAGSVVVKTITLDIVPDIFDLIDGDEELAGQMTWNLPKTKEEAMTVFSKEFEEGRVTLGIFLEEKLIGMANIQNFHWWHHDAQKASAFLNFWIATPFTCKGYGTEALRAIAQFGFDTLKLKKIFAGCFTANKRGQSVLETTGFIKIGVLKKHFLKNNAPVDSIRYELLPDDFVG